MSTLPDGFEIPIHRSLTDPILIAGLPRQLAILLWTPGMVVILGLYQLWFLPIQLVLHLLFVYLTKRDPHFFEVFSRALRAQRRLEP
jgi:type IV secretion system protein VirB3